MKQINQKLGLLFLFLIAIVLGIKQLREPDFWWMLATGEEILKSGSFVKSDIFSYTMNGNSWINVKWGFEVFLAILTRIGGPEFAHILQVIANIFLLWFFLRLSNTFNGFSFDHPAVLISGFFLLTGIDFRMNGRPEMISMLFTAISLYVLCQYYLNFDKKIWALVPLQLIWTNFHEAYGLGLVIQIIFLAGWSTELFFLHKKNWWNTIKKPLLVFALSWLACAAHPWGFRMMIHPYEIFTQVGENKFTTELVSFTDPAYWLNEAYLNVIIAALILLYLTVKIISSKETKYLAKVKSVLPVPYLLILMAFFYLSLTAYRNIPFFLIAAMPLIPQIISDIKFKGLFEKINFKNYISTALIPLFISFYILVINNNFYSFSDQNRDYYGLSVNPYMHPIGASEFLKQNNINENSLNDVLSSNYFIANNPGFKSFIDLRDLDVFSTEFFDLFAGLISEPDRYFDSLRNEYGFNHVILTRSSFAGLHQYLINKSNWNIYYADQVAVVFANDSFAKQKNLKANFDFQKIANYQPSSIAKGLSLIFNPLYNYADYDAEISEIAAIDYYSKNGKKDLALEMADKYLKINAADLPKNRSRVLVLKGNMLYNKGQTKDSAFNAQQFNQAYTLFSEASNIYPSNGDSWIGMGVIAWSNGDFNTGLLNMKKAIENDPKNVMAYVYSAELLGIMATQNPNLGAKYNQEVEKFLAKALKIAPGDPVISVRYGIILGVNKKCDEAVDILENFIDHPALNPQDAEAAKRIYINCK